MGRREWPYAELSKKASEAGGPDKLIEIIKKEAYAKGCSDTKKTLVIPLVFAGVAIGAACVLGGQKLCVWYSEKKQSRLILKQQAYQAEELLKKELNNTDKMDESDVEKTSDSTEEKDE